MELDISYSLDNEQQFWDGESSGFDCPLVSGARARDMLDIVTILPSDVGSCGEGIYLFNANLGILLSSQNFKRSSPLNATPKGSSTTRCGLT